jgi:predicted nucleic acid-binding Zn ribbon protein
MKPEHPRSRSRVTSDRNNETRILTNSATRLDNRRRFLATALGGAAGLLILPDARSARSYQANERLNLAVFGKMYNAEHFLTGAHLHNADIVALCNPDQRRIPEVFQRWDEVARQWSGSEKPQQRQAAAQYRRLADRQGIEVYADVRRMFAEMAKRIDAVIVSDYDHFHGVACGEALRAGKPVCSERPLGLTIQDARRLRALAAETGLPTTYRSPGTGTGQFRRAMELVEEDAIGPVREVHIWFQRGGPNRAERPQGRHEVPVGLDWDLWLGPLPYRDYHPDWMSYANWRETSNGGLGSFGPHTTIFPFLALKMRELWNEPPKMGLAPMHGRSVPVPFSESLEPVPFPERMIRVDAECSNLNRVSYPRWERVRWQIPARGEMPPVTVTWHHGPEFAPGTRELIHTKLRRWGVTNEQDADDLMRTAGSLLLGEQGALVADDHSVKITALPKDKFADVETNRPLRIGASRGIYVDWIEACRGGRPQILADFDHGGPLSELLMLGNIATQFPQEALDYDPATGRIANHAEANEKLGYPYRDGWRI